MMSVLLTPEVSVKMNSKKRLSCFLQNWQQWRQRNWSLFFCYSPSNTQVKVTEGRCSVMLCTRCKNCIYHRHTYSTRSTRLDITQINRLQAIQNALAHAVTNAFLWGNPKRQTHHRLKILERIKYKAIPLTYNTIQSPKPPTVGYTREQIFPYLPCLLKSK